MVVVQVWLLTQPSVEVEVARQSTRAVQKWATEVRGYLWRRREAGSLDTQPQQLEVDSWGTRQQLVEDNLGMQLEQVVRNQLVVVHHSQAEGPRNQVVEHRNLRWLAVGSLRLEVGVRWRGFVLVVATAVWVHGFGSPYWVAVLAVSTVQVVARPFVVAELEKEVAQSYHPRDQTCFGILDPN